MNFNRSIKLSDKSYVQIYNADESLLRYIEKNFDDIFALHPVHENNQKSTIMHFDTKHETPQWSEIETKRWHKNYLNTPTFDPERKHGNYMFSGKNGTEIETPLPQLLQPIYDVVKTLDQRFNQVGVNWYEGNDLIPLHSDWTENMVDNYCIGVLSLYGKNDQTRKFRIKKVRSSESISIEVGNGDLILMCGDFQNEYLHGVYKAADHESKRIGISFRQFK
jgi:hypothetical protein